MLESDKLDFKIQLYENLRGLLDTEVESISLEMSKVLASAKEEGKSSMGDKYETGRAMAHLELEKLSFQLENKRALLAYLMKVNVETLKTTVQPGAVVETTFGIFFISVQGAEIHVGSRKVIPVSLKSPLGQILSGCVAGAVLKLNGREIVVQDVY